MRSASFRRTVVALAASALILAACGSSSKSGSGSGSTTLNGSGSTFQQAFDQVAIQAFQTANSGMTVNYAGGGSGKGKTDLQTKSVDFAGTDSLPKPEDLKLYQGGSLLYFPIASAPITLSYNLSGVDALKLSPTTIAKIFQGTATTWDDAAIKADNPGVNLPATNILIVHRSEGSGTTNNFTKYLVAAAGSAWTLGSGDTVNWPSSSQAGQGNAGVAQGVTKTDGAIGYVDFADATAAKLKFAEIKNASGSFVAPTLAGAEAAVAASKFGADLSYNPINQLGPTVYPITAPTWMMAYAKQSSATQGAAVKKFITFMLNDAQPLANGANFAALPASLQQKAIAQLSKFQIPA